MIDDGTAVSADGFMETVIVNDSYSAVGTDVVIAARLHSVDGYRYLVTASGTTEVFVNGTALTDFGAELASSVDASYSPIATDVNIEGSLHSAAGERYVCTNATPGATIVIGGTAHTINGVTAIIDNSGGGGGDFLLREDGSYIIREDGGKIILE